MSIAKIADAYKFLLQVHSFVLEVCIYWCTFLLQGGVGSTLAEQSQLPRDTDLSPGQPLQSNQPSGSLGVIGRRSVADLGAIGDGLSTPPANPGGMHDQTYNLQMLEAAFYKLPQPKDSERAKSYTPVGNYAHYHPNYCCIT